ncbi:hypothetical protein DKX38_019089 [Salix brachista]|uniref:Uncharacterized protein n=1 Tax=Salix brachista TaxID=2182728 RepID=A0A5N5KPV5_9ROSI|nr:hypothetical protein DKX38_019089 [Salix brachista]
MAYAMDNAVDILLKRFGRQSHSPLDFNWHSVSDKVDFNWHSVSDKVDFLCSLPVYNLTIQFVYVTWLVANL